MPWHKIVLRDAASDEVTLPARFFGVTLNRPPNSSSATLWLQERDVPKGEAWYFLETDNPAFHPIVKEFNGKECEAPDKSLLQPIAGAAKKK